MKFQTHLKAVGVTGVVTVAISLHIHIYICIDILFYFEQILGGL